MSQLRNGNIFVASWVAVTMAFACAAVPAKATPVLEIMLQSGTSAYISTPASSPLIVAYSIGSFILTVKTGTTTGALDLSSVGINRNAGGTLVINLSARGFTSPFGAANWLTQFSANYVNVSDSVQFRNYPGSNDTLFDTGTTLSALNDTARPFSIGKVTRVAPDGSFTLTKVVTIITSGAAHVKLDGSVSYVPEPDPIGLLGAAMITTDVVGHRHRKLA